ncbi:hypothetical protein [Mycobacteroides abscessus]|uniref:hypothetical protein n=1 Tax=Mycobacteroides abscessus TaxID=36809 RepID=UPI00092AB2CB|nr:hypothetical protein [Mycobacteroides abscessus]QST89652.1 membrane protein [Mycobacterium phage prophi62-3]QST89995.1 membrane protein [Mycobacterium phage prophi108-1]MBN7458111.1 hypothetical protein [Mycobacteroides abscessus subsp. abscessus]MBN7542330.1 hypothetical protein [Mycobacteroides abscessus subsp. abscessus]MBN7569987.1 hypothetical protein [Mycobacteroides abscessus subsp. abscessus]
MPNPIPQNDTTRLIVYAVMFIVVFAGTVAMIISGKMDAASGLQWVISIAGLIGTGLPGLKLAQDIRGSGPDGSAE